MLLTNMDPRYNQNFIFGYSIMLESNLWTIDSLNWRLRSTKPWEIRVSIKGQRPLHKQKRHYKWSNHDKGKHVGKVKTVTCL